MRKLYIISLLSLFISGIEVQSQNDTSITFGLIQPNADTLIINDRVITVQNSQGYPLSTEVQLYKNNKYISHIKYEYTYDTTNVTSWKESMWNTSNQEWDITKTANIGTLFSSYPSRKGSSKYRWNDDTKDFDVNYRAEKSLLLQNKEIPYQFVFAEKEYSYKVPEDIFINYFFPDDPIVYTVDTSSDRNWLSTPPGSNRVTATPGKNLAGRHKIVVDANSKNTTRNSTDYQLLVIILLTQEEINNYLTLNEVNDTSIINISKELPYIKEINTGIELYDYPFGFINTDSTIYWDFENEEEISLTIHPSADNIPGKHVFYARFRNSSETDLQTCIGFGIETDNDKNVTIVPVDWQVAVKEVSEIKVNVYPNPCSDKVVIKADNLKGITLYDLTGRMVERDIYYQTDGKTVLNVSGLQTGMYILQVNISGQIFSKQLIVR